MSYDNGITFDSLGTRPWGAEGAIMDFVNVIDRDGNPLAYEVPRWKANWDFKRRYSPAIASMMDSWDGGDPWGSAMSMGWAVAMVARALDEAEPANTLSVSWGMEPKYAIDELAGADTAEIQFEAVELAVAVQEGRVTIDDLKFAARVLNRYLAILDRAGHSY